MDRDPVTGPSRLRASGLRDPVGVPVPEPDLSWSPAGVEADDYVIELVSISIDGRERETTFVSPGTSTRIAWPLPPMAARDQVSWRVGARRGALTTWSREASIETPPWTLADDATFVSHPDWVDSGGQLPAGAPEFRHTFEFCGNPQRARLAVATPGIAVAHLNGTRVSEEHLAPGYAQLASQTPAVVWDVSDLLRPGSNELHIEVGTGIGYVADLPDRYSKFTTSAHPPVLLAALYTDSPTPIAATGPGWGTRLGLTALSHWYGGEDRRTETGSWVDVVPVDRAAPPRWRGTPPILQMESLEPVAVDRRADGSRVVDFGVNSAGRPVVDVGDVPMGVTVRMHPSELLDEHGAVDQRSTGSPIFDSFVAHGRPEHFAPEFTYHGGRYLHVEGLDPSAPDGTTTFDVLRVANERVGSFASSDPFLGRLHQIIDRAVQSNMYSVFTDCPHREKLGWLDQLYLCFETLAMNWDVEAHLADTVEHLIHAQESSGLVPSTVPELVVFDTFPWKGDRLAFRDDPNWGRAIVELPWQLYRHYGAVAPLRRAYPAALRYLDYLRSRSKDGLLNFGLGDWIELDDTTPRSLVATHGLAAAFLTASRSAAALGDHARAAAFGQDAQRTWTAMRSAFMHKDGTWGSGSQGSWALGWSDPFASAEEREHCVAGLRAAIDAADGAITVGEIALPWFIRALTDHGDADLLLRTLSRSDAAGYGYQIASGATALTESWAGPDASHGVASQNHFMLGMIDAWLIGDVAGLRQAPDGVGWNRVVVAPVPVTGVNDASVTFESPRGRLEVAWHRVAGTHGTVTLSAPRGVEVDVRVPPGWHLDETREG